MALFGSKKPQASSVTLELMKNPPVQARGLNGDQNVKPGPTEEKGGVDVAGAFRYFVMSAFWQPLGYGKNGVALTMQNVKDNALTIWTQAFPVEDEGEAEALLQAWVDAYAGKGGFDFAPPRPRVYGDHSWTERQGVSPEDERNVVIFESLRHNGYLYLVIGEARRPVMKNGLARNMDPYMQTSLRI